MISPKQKRDGLSPTIKKQASNFTLSKTEKQLQEKTTSNRANHKKKVSLNEVIMSQTQAVGGVSGYFTQGS